MFRSTRKVAVFFVLTILIVLNSRAQTAEKWDLRKCVEYALQNNISIKQADLQIEFAKLDFQQSKLSQYPSANFSGNVGYSSGRNQDPTSFGLITTGYLFSNYSLQSSVDLFNWFTKKNTVILRDINVQATKAGSDKARNDVGFNVAVAYLQILLAKEQVNLSRIQLSQTRVQLENTRKQVDVGNLPELSAAQIEAQYATDSSNFITAETNTKKLLLQLKALLQLAADADFDIAPVPVDLIPVESIADLQPAAVYTLALQNMPQQKVDELNVKAAQKNVEIAKGSMYPTFSLFGSLGSAYNNKAQEIISKTQINPAIGTVTVGSTTYSVFPAVPYYNYSYGKISYFDQVNQNFRQSIGLGLSVPIFNGSSLRTAWQKSKLSLKQSQLVKDQNSFTLQQDIYKAYNDAVAALQKFNANKKTVESAQKAYDFASKRYELNLLSTFELLSSQNALLTAKIQMLYSQYDYVFKIKLLEYYKGQGIKL